MAIRDLDRTSWRRRRTSGWTLPTGLLCAGILLVNAVALGCSDDRALTVQRLSKDKGQAGDELVIHGSGFQSDGVKRVRVYFGNQQAKVKKFIGNDQILIEVPGGNNMGKTVDVQIIFEPGGAKQLAKAFKYIEISRLKVDDFENKKPGQ